MQPAWIFPLALSLAAVAGLEVVYLLLRRHLPRLAERISYQLWTLSLGVVSLLAAGRELTLLPPRLESRLLAIAGFLAAVLSVTFAWRLFDRLLVARRLDARGRPAVPRLVRDLGAWLALALGLILGAVWFFDASLSGLALPSAVVSAVLGFALQDVLKNVFAGLALQTEEPFDIGDWIVVDGEPRRVVEMSWRTTQLRSSLGVDYREPNANLVSTEIVNLGAGERPVGFAVTVGIAYGAPPRLVKEALERAAREAPGVAREPAPAALVAGFGDSAVTYELRYWSREVEGVARVRDAVLSRVWYRLHRDGWTIPFPMRTVQIETSRRIADDKRAWRSGRAEELLARTDLFAELDPAVRRRLAAAAGHHYYDAGERLVVEGEHGESLMLLSRGSVSVSKSGAEVGTSRLALATLDAGEYFGEMSLLTGAPRSATVTADGAVEVFVLDRAALSPILESDPAIAEALSRRLAERMAATAARIEDRRGEAPRAEASDAQTLLRRIRSFFHLGSRGN